jgi:hypothetical protein
MIAEQWVKGSPGALRNAGKIGKISSASKRIPAGTFLTIALFGITSSVNRNRPGSDFFESDAVFNRPQ